MLYVTDVIENPEKNMEFLEKVKKMQIPVLLLINKIDQTEASASSVRNSPVVRSKLHARVAEFGCTPP